MNRLYLNTMHSTQLSDETLRQHVSICMHRTVNMTGSQSTNQTADSAGVQAEVAVPWGWGLNDLYRNGNTVQIIPCSPEVTKQATVSWWRDTFKATRLPPRGPHPCPSCMHSASAGAVVGHWSWPTADSARRSPLRVSNNTLCYVMNLQLTTHGSITPRKLTTLLKRTVNYSYIKLNQRTLGTVCWVQCTCISSTTKRLSSNRRYNNALQCWFHALKVQPESTNTSNRRKIVTKNRLFQ